MSSKTISVDIATMGATAHGQKIAEAMGNFALEQINHQNALLRKKDNEIITLSETIGKLGIELDSVKTMKEGGEQNTQEAVNKWKSMLSEALYKEVRHTYSPEIQAQLDKRIKQ